MSVSHTGPEPDFAGLVHAWVGQIVSKCNLFKTETTYTYHPTFERAVRALCVDDVQAERAPRDRRGSRFARRLGTWLDALSVSAVHMHLFPATFNTHRAFALLAVRGQQMKGTKALTRRW